jgi:hypothetical protein
MVGSWQRELIRAIRQAMDTGELRADVQPRELVFDLYGVILVLHHDARLMNSPDAQARARRAFERLIAACRTPSRTVPTRRPARASRAEAG